jgi:integrase
MKLTQPSVNSLALPAGKTDAIYFDDDVPGLGLRLRGGGRRSWIFQYGIGAKQRRMTLGTAPALTLAAARNTAADLHARVHLGEDPAAAKREGQRRAADTFEATLRLYLPEKKRTLAPVSYAATERHLLRCAKPLHGLGIALVSRRDIGALLAALAASSGAAGVNRARASLSAFFAWCMARGLIEQNPVVGTHVAPEQPRTRVLSLAELATIWRACGDVCGTSAAGTTYSAIVKLLILTGQRREEIGGLRFDEICGGYDVIALPESRTKNKQPHLIPLSAPALEILAGRPRAGDFVFGGAKPFVSWSYGRSLLEVALSATDAQLKPWTLHDLRRSVATGMAELGVAPHIVEAVLNHVSGHKAGVAGIYNRATYEKEKRAALVIWAEHVLAAVEGREATVVPMRA